MVFNESNALPSPLRSLLPVGSFQQILDSLQVMSYKYEIIAFGPEGHFVYPDSCYVIVWDTASSKIITVYGKNDMSGRYDYIHKKCIPSNDFKEMISGKTVVFVQMK